ncbi:MAG: FAD-dependent thymidylate synthase [Candidatus Methanospirareceae archaeon]
MKVKLLRVTEDGVNLVAETAKVSGSLSEQSAEEILGLITENDYSSVLEHISFTFDISEISVALSRELLEHRVGVSHTARSTRYNEEEGFGYFVPDELSKKQNFNANLAFTAAMRNAKESYKKLRRLGVAREQARYVLPLALHTHYVVTMNARSLINFFMLRLCVRAAPEMQALAKRLHEICVAEYPDIFSRVGCRGVTWGVCPENEVRPAGCPFKECVPTKSEVKAKMKNQK